MNAPNVSDVFISYAQSDTAWAAEVQRRLKEAGLRVFTVGEALPSQNLSDLIWDALTESSALIALVRSPGAVSKYLSVEIGAAMAWQKPVYVLYQGAIPTDLPKYVEQFGVFPASSLGEVISRINEAEKLFSKDERLALGKAYVSVGVPTDQLLLQPAKIQELARAFNRATKANISGERLLREILRLRKQGKFPRLGLKRTRMRGGPSRQKTRS
jgi:hypothetical protein